MMIKTKESIQCLICLFAYLIHLYGCLFHMHDSVQLTCMLTPIPSPSYTVSLYTSHILSRVSETLQMGKWTDAIKYLPRQKH